MKFNHSYPALIHKEKGTYGASFFDFPGCISAGKNLDEVWKNAKDGLELHIEAMIEDGDSIPEPTKVFNYSVDQFRDLIAIIWIPIQFGLKKQNEISNKKSRR